MDEEAFNSVGSRFGSNQQELKDNNNNNGGGGVRAEIDTSVPFESVMEAVTRFGGIGFWKNPHPHNRSFQPSKANNEKASDTTKIDDQVTKLQNNLLTKERETLEILKEIEATTRRFEELKVKLLKEVKVKVNTHPSDDQNDDSNTNKVHQSNEVELSKTEILKRVEEATEEVKHCTRVLEEALSRVNASRQKSTEFKNSDCKMVESEKTMSIGQILSRKLVLVEEHSEKSCMRWKISLAQVLSKASNREKKRGGGGCCDGIEKGGVLAKKMKFGFCV